MVFHRDLGQLLPHWPTSFGLARREFYWRHHIDGHALVGERTTRDRLSHQTASLVEERQERMIHMKAQQQFGAEYETESGRARTDQKFSIVHIFPLSPAANKARWRPSGDGIAPITSGAWFSMIGCVWPSKLNRSSAYPTERDLTQTVPSRLASKMTRSVR